MREVNASILGDGPIHGETHIGSDCQLWKWSSRGQVTVATGGAEALRYAEQNGFPASVVELLRAKSVVANTGGHRAE